MDYNYMSKSVMRTGKNEKQKVKIQYSASSIFRRPINRPLD